MEDFNVYKHNLEYFKNEWGINKDTRLFKDLDHYFEDKSMMCYVLWVFVNTCHYCYNGDSRCQCWRGD